VFLVSPPLSITQGSRGNSRGVGVAKAGIGVGGASTLKTPIPCGLCSSYSFAEGLVILRHSGPASERRGVAMNLSASIKGVRVWKTHLRFENSWGGKSSVKGYGITSGQVSLGQTGATGESFIGIGRLAAVAQLLWGGKKGRAEGLILGGDENKREGGKNSGEKSDRFGLGEVEPQLKERKGRAAPGGPLSGRGGGGAS